MPSRGPRLSSLPSPTPRPDRRAARRPRGAGPGLPPDLARALGRCRPGPLGWRDFDEAQARGWWCAAARQPEALVRVMDQGGRTDVTLDLSPADLAFTPAAFTEIDQA